MSDPPRPSGAKARQCGGARRWTGRWDPPSQEALGAVQDFFVGGFLGLPFLWFVSCYSVFCPVLQASLAEMKEEFSRRDLSAGEEPTEFTPVLLEEAHQRRFPSPQKDKIVAFCKLSFPAPCFLTAATSIAATCSMPLASVGPEGFLTCCLLRHPSI